MPEPTVRELATDAEWDEAVPILGQLWTEKPEAEIRAWRRDEAEYRLLGLYDGDDLVGVAGLYCQVVLHHERTGWIHDLVVDEPRRGEGYGEALLDAATEWARERGCETVALVSALDNDEATRFYEDVGMERFGHVFERRRD